MSVSALARDAGGSQISASSPLTNDLLSLSPDERALDRTFRILQALGEAQNAGVGGEETLRQACALLQEGAGRFVDPQLGLLFDRAGAELDFQRAFSDNLLGSGSFMGQIQQRLAWIIHER